MEIITILIFMWAVKVMFTDGVYAVRGQTPPRVQQRMAALQAGTGGAAPRRYGARDYFRDLWHDAMEDAREHREKKRADAKAAAADDGRDGGGNPPVDPAQAPGPSLVPPPPEVPTMPPPPGAGGPQRPGGADGGDQPRYVDATPTDWPGWGTRRGPRPPMPDLPDSHANLFYQYFGALHRLGDDSWNERMQAKSWDELRAFWERVVSLTPEELCAELNAELHKAYERAVARAAAADQDPPADQAGDGDQHTPLADVLPIRPVSKEDTVSNTTSAPAPEATGLTSAIAYAQQMAATFGNNAASTEQWIASLQGQGGVSGPAITAAQQAVEKQQECAAAWAACATALGGHTAVKEAYQANEGAGTREFVTSD